MRANEHERIRNRILEHFKGSKDASIDWLIFYADLLDGEIEDYVPTMRESLDKGFERKIKSLKDAIIGLSK